MGSTNIKRSIVRNGHKTSVSLEQEFWEGLREIAASQKQKLTTLVQKIDQNRDGANLSSAIRVFVFNQLRGQVAGAPENDRASPARPISNMTARSPIDGGAPMGGTRALFRAGLTAPAGACARRAACVSVAPINPGEYGVNLFSKLLEREAAGKPVTVGVIGAGKFGTMFLSQARLTRGMHVAGVADLDVGARAQPA